MSLSPSLTSKLGFLAPKSVEKTINNAKFRFYAVRVPMVAELLALSGPIASALSVLFSSTKDLRALKTKQQTIKMPEGGEQVTLDTEAPAMPLETMKHREESTRTAIRDIVDVLVGSNSRNILGRFVADSMRDEFQAGYTDDDVRDFWSNLDIDIVMQFVGGALEANAAVIRPFLGKAALNLRTEATDALREKLGSVLNLKQPSPAPETTASTSDAPSSSS